MCSGDPPLADTTSIQSQDSKRYTPLYSESPLNLVSLSLSLSLSLYIYIYIYIYIFFFVALRTNAGHGFLILKVLYITHNDAPQSVRLLWMSDQLVAETST